MIIGVAEGILAEMSLILKFPSENPDLAYRTACFYPSSISFVDFTINPLDKQFYLYDQAP